MEKDKLEKLATTALIVIFVFLLILTLSRRKGTKAVSMEEKPKQIEQDIFGIRMEKQAAPADMQWGRDPFSLTPDKQTETGTFQLSAVIWDETNPIAIINNEVVGIGQEIDGCQVIKINKDNVILKKGEEERVVELYQ